MPGEFWVWNEVGDMLGEFDSQSMAEEQAERERKACAVLCGTDGKESYPGRGDFICGTLHPHGIFVQIIEDDEDATTRDYGQYH